jgi:hypothetical protein
MRSLLLLPLLLGLVMAPPAHAGIGGLLKAVSAAGKLTKGAKLAKGASVLKGAKVLGAGVAAERVFAHGASSGARLGVFVADDGAGAIKLVMKGGDAVSETPASLRKTLADLDEMASATPDAGVDVFVDPSMVRRLGELDVGPNTRLFLANTEGASTPLRKAGDGVQLGVGRDGSRFWVNVTSEVLQQTVGLMGQRTGGTTVVVTDPDCEGQLGNVRVDSDLHDALEGQEGTVVVITESPLSPMELRKLASEHGLDLVQLGLAEVCAPAVAAPATLTDLIDRALLAPTVGDLWTLAQDDAAPLMASELHGWLVVSSQALAAAHRPVALPDADSDEPPLWFILLASLALLAFLAYKIRVAMRPAPD